MQFSLEMLALMLQNAQLTGRPPINFLMSSPVYAEYKRLAGEPPRSMVQNFLIRLGIGKVHTSFGGVPVIEVPPLAREVVMLQLDDNERTTMVPADIQQAEQHQPRGIDREIEEEAGAVVDDVVTVDSLFKQEDGKRPSSSEILVRMTADSDRMARVLVIALREGGRIDIESNCNQIEAIGMLDSARMRLYQGE
jgi:hypothetical protein